jgi:hypothetical protein
MGALILKNQRVVDSIDQSLREKWSRLKPNNALE